MTTTTTTTPTTCASHPHSYSAIQIEDDRTDAPEGGGITNNTSSSGCLERHLTLLDLIAVGIGGTIGSGLFVLVGLVSHQYAGPSAVLSWAVSGLAALLSGCCYAELSARIPLPGSAYAYCFVALGEWPAFLAATCLSLEYIVACGAVARSWGDKCALWLLEELGMVEKPPTSRWVQILLNTDNSIFNPLACFIATACTCLLLCGVRESKFATNFFTMLKVSLVVFMIVVGSFYIQPKNWTPFIPFGIGGTFRGATATFFGYLGYDQVSGMAGEAIRPKRNLPLAIIFTLVSVTCIYMTATLVLTGMQFRTDISSVSGFPSAFYAMRAGWAGRVSAVGEILTLPIVVLITTMIQPRLQYAMAEDGLLPAFFRQLDTRGNLWNGTIVSGSLVMLVATVIPFQNMNDMISCAVLMVLSLTDSSLILLWHEHPTDPESNLPQYLVLVFNLACLVTSFFWNQYLETKRGWTTAIVTSMVTCAIPVAITWLCPRTRAFGGRRKHVYHEDDLIRDDSFFRTPFVPYLPCLGIFINWYLISQLDVSGICGLIAILGMASGYYFGFAAKNSMVSLVDDASFSRDDNTVDETSRLTLQSD